MADKINIPQGTTNKGVTAWGIAKWVLYVLSMLGIIAATFVAAILTD